MPKKSSRKREPVTFDSMHIVRKFKTAQPIPEHMIARGAVTGPGWELESVTTSKSDLSDKVYCFVCRRYYPADQYFRRHLAHQQYLKIEVNPIINKKLAALVSTGLYGSCHEEAVVRILCEALDKK